jgi:hypothetical protein
MTANQLIRRLVRGLLQTSNMTMEFHDPVGCRVAAEGAGFAARKYLKICVAYLMPFATFPRP